MVMRAERRKSTPRFLQIDLTLSHSYLHFLSQRSMDPLHRMPVPCPLDRFIAAASADGGRFMASSKAFRIAIGKEEGQKNKRLETPSAHLASSQAEDTRKRFERDVVEADGNHEQKRLWLDLSVDEQDEFICRIFAPSILGGFFDDDL